MGQRERTNHPKKNGRREQRKHTHTEQPNGMDIVKYHQVNDARPVCTSNRNNCEGRATTSFPDLNVLYVRI